MILQVLNVLIGLALVFLIFSTISSAFFELVEALLKRRGRLLVSGIRAMLHKLSSNDAAALKRLYEHPMIYGLYEGAFDPDGSKLPSYIPPIRFARAVVMLAEDSESLADADPFVRLVGYARRQVGQRNLKADESFAQAVEKEIVDHFNESMDRLTGRFGRYARRITFVIGLVVAVVANVDTLQIVQTLSMDPALADRISDQAARYVEQKTNADLKRDAPPSDEDEGELAADESTSESGSQDVKFTAQTAPAGAITNSTAVTVKDTEPTSDVAPTEALTPPAPAPKADGVAAPAPGSPLPPARPPGDASKADVAKSKPIPEVAGSVPASSSPPAAPPADASNADLVAKLETIRESRELAESLGLPLGWPEGEVKRVTGDIGAIARKFVGFLLTALALSFGAPFWFDVLNKLVKIRSSLKPADSGPDDAAEELEDRPSRATPPATDPSNALAPDAASAPVRPPSMPIGPSARIVQTDVKLSGESMSIGPGASHG